MRINPINVRQRLFAVLALTLTLFFFLALIHPALARRAINEPGPAIDKPQPSGHVLIVSIDGLDARYLANRDSYGLKIPALRSLMADGATASGVLGVYPTLTYPSHTSIVTGALPIKHGIFGNDLPGPPDVEGNIGAYWYARDIKAQTLWDAAREAGMKVGLVSWPVAGGAGDFNVPEIWKPGGNLNDNKIVTEENSIPSGIVKEIEKAEPELYKQFTADEGDDMRSRIAAYIVEKKRPQMMLVHLWDLDHWEHNQGPFTPEAFSILEKVDGDVARILDSYRRAGISGDTTVFIVSDHGFLPVAKQIRPAVLLFQNGLINLTEHQGADGKTRLVVKDWKAFPYVTAGSCTILLRDPGDTATLNKVKAIFQPLAGKEGTGIRQIFERDEIRALGGNPQAAVMLEAEDGYSFSTALAGELIAPSRQKGTHGYLPSRYRASFIASGYGVKRRGRIGEIRMIDIGPTIARASGLSLRDADGRPVKLD
jgi:predicted AlkP superfamily pyrophosphatase or phosphodiesterase